MIGDFIRQAREARGMEQEDLGLAIDKSGGYISSIETGRKKGFPEPKIIRALARELGISVGDIVREAGYLTDGAHDASAHGAYQPETPLELVRESIHGLQTIEGLMREATVKLAAMDAAAEARDTREATPIKELARRQRAVS